MRKKANYSKRKTDIKAKKNNGRSRRLDPNMEPNKFNDIRDLNNNINLSANDPDWYMHNQSLAEAAGNIPFSYAIGTPIPAYNGKEIVVPGVCSLMMVPAFGRALSMSDPINIAAVKYYSYVRHQNSGHANYDATDLMMYTLALGQAYSAHEWMKRIYGYLNTYSVTNRYIPRAYAAADYIDFDDFIKNLADFRYFINEIAVKLSAFAIPQYFDLFKRHRYIYSNIHMDDPSSRASLYMFTPAGFYKYDNTASETGTSLQWSEWTHTGVLHTFSGLVSYINDLLDKVFGDEDAGIMSGDILKAYGNEAIYQPTAIEFDYSVLPIYDETILSQIHNASFYGPITAKPVNQTGNGIIQNQQLLPISSSYPRESSFYEILTTSLDNPTPADVFEMSRLVAKKNTIGGNDDNCVINGGSELVTGIQIYTWNRDTNTFDLTEPRGTGYRIGATAEKYILQYCNVLTKFNHHPILQYINTNDNDRHIVVGDVDNVTSISAQQLDNLHMTALLSLFGV